MEIYYRTHAQIDKQKWDSCIDDAHNGLLYSYSFYLDAMSKNWSGLIMDNYDAVMPLTSNKKFGISYLHQPFFTQQLGIFGNLSFTEDITDAFVKKAVELFPFAEINLNYANECKKTIAKKSNCILSLNNSFAEIEKNFKKDLIQNIKKANKNNLIYTATQDIETAITSYKKNYFKKIHIPQKAYYNFSLLCGSLLKKKQLLVRKIISPNGQLLAIAIFLKDKKRIYNIMSTTFNEGRKAEANHFLLYNLIKEFCGQNLILDFEGSEIPSINFFYKKFGAIEQPYPFVKINQLPLWQRSFKYAYDSLKKII